jgi:hypothetical protein
MIYLNLKTSTLRSPEFIGSEPTARATWLSLICYCCEQENGGIIPECLGWKDRQWQQTCGVTHAEVNESSDLWQWSGNALAVAFYPKDKEVEVQAKREAGRRGGKRSGKARREASHEAVQKAPREAELQAELQAVLQADLEGKGKEGKGIERERKVGRVAAIAATNDEEWLSELSKNPAYASLDIRIELGKMQAWCSANQKQPSRKRFINWLNRSEKPIAVNGTAKAAGRTPSTVWELKQAIDAIKTQMSRLKGDPDNTEAKDSETPWERRMKPAIAEKMRELKDREQELHNQLAMLGKEHTPTLKL